MASITNQSAESADHETRPDDEIDAFDPAAFNRRYHGVPANPTKDAVKRKPSP
jgi:hypothetical protein